MAEVNPATLICLGLRFLCIDISFWMSVKINAMFYGILEI